MAPLVVAAGAEAILAIDIAQTVLVQIVGQMVSAVIESVFAPELLALQQSSFGDVQSKALDPTLAVDAQIKGHRSYKDALNDVRQYGYAEDLFKVMLAVAGEPLDLQSLMEAWRRQIIPKEGLADNSISLQQGIFESRLKNKWMPVVEALQFRLPEPGVLIEGWIRNVISEATARDQLYKQGFDTAAQDLLHLAAGRPLSPQEGYLAFHRGLIPEEGSGPGINSLHQLFLETDLKDKYWPIYRALAEYRPPPRTITALHRAGVFTDAQAEQLYLQEGLSPEMAADYVKAAHHERAAQTKELTKAELVSLYVDGGIDAAELEKRLLGRGWSKLEADAERELADLRAAHALQVKAINRIGSLYVSRRVDKESALKSLDGLKLQRLQRDRLIQTWDLERAAVVRHLTPAEIATAVKDGALTPQAGLEAIVAQGFGHRDAWILLTIHKAQTPTPTAPTDNLPPL